VLRTGSESIVPPGSAVHAVVGHPAALIGGLRALIVQALHPLAMAGVAEHSDYRERPLARLRRTAYYVNAAVFGDRATAEAAAARVRAIHRRVRGVDPVTGRRYSAEDPDLLLWVHCVEWHSFLVSHRVYGRPRLTPADEDRFVAGGVPVAALVGTPPERTPATVAELRGYLAAVRPELALTEAAREAIGFIVDPPLSAELLPVRLPQQVLAQAAVATIPRDIRQLAGIDRPAALDVLAIAAGRAATASFATPPVRRLVRLVLGSEIERLRRSARARAAAGAAPALASTGGAGSVNVASPRAERGRGPT
jgi:uncharacterized protein (DUF2236 family)